MFLSESKCQRVTGDIVHAAEDFPHGMRKLQIRGPFVCIPQGNGKFRSTQSVHSPSQSVLRR